MKFEQLEVWQKACRLSEAMYLECKELKGYCFKDQLSGLVCLCPPILQRAWSEKV